MSRARVAVVKTSCLDVLYKDLPVVIVNEWSDVNMDLLTAASADFANTQYDYSGLTVKHWIERIYSH
jgi:hypothetical protein